MSEPREIEGNPVAVVGGLVVGMLLSWFLTAVAVIISLAAWGDHSTGTKDYVLEGLALLAGPVAGLVALKSARLRSWLLIGFALGTIVGSGVCTTMWVAG